MQYFKPIDQEIEGIIFQNWSLAARDDKEYKERRLDRDPKIIPITKIPKFIFNISTKIIQENGTFIDRNPKDFEIAKKIAVQEHKEKKLKELDFNTSNLIKQGFSFDNNIFSLSSNAQLNWQNIMAMLNLDLYQDSKISTLDNKEYLLTKDLALDFIKSYYNRLNSILDDNRNNKIKILEMSDDEYVKDKNESEFNNIPF